MSVRMNYHDFPYHNWQHVVTVMQTMFAMITVNHSNQCISVKSCIVALNELSGETLCKPQHH